MAKDAQRKASAQWGEMDGNGEEEGGGGGCVDLGVANGRRQRGKCGGWKRHRRIGGLDVMEEETQASRIWSKKLRIYLTPAEIKTADSSSSRDCFFFRFLGE